MAFTPKDFFGALEPPQGASSYASGDITGLIMFLNNALKITIVIAGIYTLFNLITAGITYIGSSGDPKNIQKTSSTIWMSILGLTIIASSLTLAALIGLIFFGDATAILSPKIPDML